MLKIEDALDEVVAGMRGAYDSGDLLLAKDLTTVVVDRFAGAS